MSDNGQHLHLPEPGAVAWLDISADNPDAWAGRRRTGPLGLQIAPLRSGRGRFYFSGARLRGSRCVWAAATISGAELSRAVRPADPATHDAYVHILARADAPGSVFEPGEDGVGTFRVMPPDTEIAEQFGNNTHLYTLNVPQAALGLDLPATRSMFEHTYTLTPFQLRLLRGAVGILLAGENDLDTPSSLVGVDRYLAALSALLLRTAVQRPGADAARAEDIRGRTDAIIFEQAADPALTPASIASQLNISLRQLYRAFSGTESPAARIRRRRLERAAEILAARSGTGQVERVAAECGFSSAEYFSRAFRREFGLSPRAYRSAHRDSSLARYRLGPDTAPLVERSAR